MMTFPLRSLFLLAVVAGLTAAIGLPTPGQVVDQQVEEPPAVGFPLQGILPKVETGAAQFLKEHPEYDGRGTVVAIFDTGVDPAAVGLSTTPQGKPKFVDFVDGTGSGDVDTSTRARPQEGKLNGKTGRELTIDPSWTNPSGEYRLGMAVAYDLFPSEDLVARLKRERRRDWEQTQRRREQQLQLQLDEATEDSDPSKEELQAHLKVLQEMNESYEDPGPIYDCVLFNDGQLWRAVVDTDEDGDLTNEKVLTDYDKEPGFGTFRHKSELNFTVHIYDGGDTLSIVIPSGDHGTHVAGIVGAYEPDRPQRNGIAPGCQIVSVKIGDTRLGGMETGAGLVRGINAVLEHECDLVNMSYGEPSTVANDGRLQDLFNELVREHGVIFVSSAGNAGPALSTVGAPGGTTSGMIGVGAYVSPEMMDVEYTVREKTEGTAYTWTSRGPTFDGDWGVDIFAPGGAIAPVPTYTLQRTRQMNGTSMASPNACGNIALLLSAMKQEGTDYTNWSVKRAIQNTAQTIPNVSRFAQGAGLIQVGKAYEYLTAWHDAPGETTEIRVMFPARDNARGIYLREPFETDEPFEATAMIVPSFPRSTPNEEKLSHELELKWSASADWVDVGEHMILQSGGRVLPVRVEPQQLPEGVHSAEIVARDANQPARGPLVRIPVVVVRTAEATGKVVKWTVNTRSGDVVRKFLSVPEGATWGELEVKRLDAEAQRLGFLHCVQLVPGQTFEEGETVEVLRLDPLEDRTVKVPLTGGRTLEVCWGHYWSSQGEAEIEFEMTYRGISTRESTVALPTDASAVRADARSMVHRETCRPTGSLKTWRRVLAPTNSGEIEPLPGERNVLWDNARTYRRVVSYKFHLDDGAKVSLHCPELEGLLYDAPVDHFLMTLKNSDGREIGWQDIYPEEPPFDLKKGDYTIELDLRHLDPDALDRWADARITVDQLLSSPINVPAFPTRAAAAGTGGTFSSTALAPGDETTLWFRFPDGAKLPKGALAGDMLVGSVQLTDEAPSLSHGRETFTLTYTIPPQQASGTAEVKKSSAGAEQAYLAMLLEEIGKLEWPEDREQINKLSEDYRAKMGDELKLAKARLHVIDNESRGEHLPDVVEAADRVISLVDQNQLRNYFGVRHDPQTKSEKELEKERTGQKEALVDALYRKGRALAHMEAPEVAEKHPIEDQAAHDKLFEATFQDLARWVDTTDPKYALLHVRRDWRKGNYGQALKLLNETYSGADSGLMHDEKRQKLFDLLGWPEWRDYQSHWILRRYPNKKDE